MRSSHKLGDFCLKNIQGQIAAQLSRIGIQSNQQTSLTGQRCYVSQTQTTRMAAGEDDKSTSLVKVKYSDDYQCNLTIAGRVASQPVLQNQQQQAQFMLRFLTKDDRLSYCQVELSGEVCQRIQNVSEGDILVIKGYLLPVSGSLYRIAAAQIANLVNAPQKILDIPIAKVSGLKDQPQEAAPDAQDTQAKWDHLLKNPNQWWDMREENEPGSRRPAFQHRTQKDIALWINPAAMPDKVDLILSGDGELAAKFPGWKRLMAHPEEFWDNHAIRPTERHPHFVHKMTGKALWYDENNATPEQQQFFANVTDPEYDGPKPTDPWEDLFKNPGKWYDNRQKKTNERAPDFSTVQQREDGTRTGLWLGTCPQDKREKLEELDSSGVQFAM
eukprot:TRINITY_DN755_c0_g3_i1.p1 TRINITY_DN755_c0_g3~~TRINITY_DN755_c0_g3_i1.p1  ORF type:complete len:386 (-),score=36.42 TRINITY_DN755_c0_g3_i1:192-1349(-)